MSNRTKVYFDGNELTRGFVVSDLRVSMLPKNVETVAVPGRDGTLYQGATLAERSVTLTLTVRERTQRALEEATRSLAAALDVDAPAPLAISIWGGLYLMAIPVSDGDGARKVNAVSYEVTFRATDPSFHGGTRTVEIPSGDSATFRVRGTLPCAPILEVTGARGDSNNNWTLMLDDGSFMRVQLPSGSASRIVADCESRTLKVNGATKVLSPESDWMVLGRGDRTVTMTGTASTATLTFHERWV